MGCAFCTRLAARQAGHSSVQKSSDSFGSTGLCRNHLLYISCVLFLVGLKGQEFLHPLLTGETVKYHYHQCLFSNERTLYDSTILTEPLKQTGKFCFLLLGIFPLSFHHGSWESTKVRCVLPSIPFLLIFSKAPEVLQVSRTEDPQSAVSFWHMFKTSTVVISCSTFFRSINNYILHFNSYIISCTLSSFTLKNQRIIFQNCLEFEYTKVRIYDVSEVNSRELLMLRSMLD